MNERDIFIEALQKETPAERRAYLDEVCRGDEALRRSVEALLEVHERAGSFLKPPVPSPVLTVEEPPISERPGTVIGPYKLLEQIGEGGFGIVFMAEQHQPIRRKVALKVLKPGMDTRQVIARFEAERQALALMDHPHIAKILNAGQTSSGRPYFVMDLVKGLPLTDYCDQNQLTPREQLELFVDVCQAVQHAHQKGIIHRDLKPSNVLVTLQDGTPLVKVIDFGVAKALGQQLTDKTLFTGFAQMIGTPLYMSPEQAALSNVDVDTRSDIYSLGVLLYELLTGTTPLEKKRFKEAAWEEIRRLIREEEPPRPSTRISTLGQAATTVSAQRQSDPKRLSQLFRGELDWIVMKCLEKDRNRRYDTANGLGRDIERYLHDEPVQACPPTAGYRLRKFVRRHKAAVAFTLSAVLAVLLAVVVLAVSNVLITREKNEKAAALDQTEQERRLAQENLRTALDAVNQMLTEVADKDLAEVPQMEPVRRALLEKALAFYQGFLQQSGTDPSMRLETAKAYHRVGTIHFHLGRYDEAEKALGEAIGLLEKLTAESPADAAPRAALAESLFVVGKQLHERWRRADAEAVLLRGLGQLETLAAQLPDEAGYRLDQADF